MPCCLLANACLGHGVRRSITWLFSTVGSACRRRSFPGHRGAYAYRAGREGRRIDNDMQRVRLSSSVVRPEPGRYVRRAVLEARCQRTSRPGRPWPKVNTSTPHSEDSFLPVASHRRILKLVGHHPPGLRALSPHGAASCAPPAAPMYRWMAWGPPHAEALPKFKGGDSASGSVPSLPTWAH